MKKVLLIDNYDSFTYNLVQYLQELGCEVIVKRNDNVVTKEAEEIQPDALVFSPGPGTVENARDIGNGIEIFEHFRGKIPILGVCLGHQMIGKYFGGDIQKVFPVHGKRWPIQIIKKTGLFRNFPDQIEGMRYHSLVVTRDTFPPELTITAETEDGLVMACEKADERIFGIQFHPESIGTASGMDILKNFLSLETPINA
ncbi:aminodeoxychorismate/anthranilate synthase component II [Candidatus Gracilibacteria bacterium]|nr:aminodeoxychorismate/anthranilate synthase component II [Candidatus Gracilibacteria bacterium]